MTIEELKKLIVDGGCVGAGGAGFPSAVKLAEGADSLVINAAECEPLLYSDYALMKQHLADIAAGAEYVIEATGIKKGYLGLKEHTAHRLGLQDGEAISAHVVVKTLPNVYPMGDEIILIYQTLGRVVPPKMSSSYSIPAASHASLSRFLFSSSELLPQFWTTVFAIAFCLTTCCWRLDIPA